MLFINVEHNRSKLKDMWGGRTILDVLVTLYSYIYNYIDLSNETKLQCKMWNGTGLITEHERTGLQLHAHDRRGFW